VPAVQVVVEAVSMHLALRVPWGLRAVVSAHPALRVARVVQAAPLLPWARSAGQAVRVEGRT
jgi:hypothetical protein